MRCNDRENTEKLGDFIFIVIHHKKTFLREGVEYGLFKLDSSECICFGLFVVLILICFEETATKIYFFCIYTVNK